MRIAITSQNLDPRIVVSGISTVASTIIELSKNEMFFYEMGYRDGDKKNFKWLLKQLKFIFHFPLFLFKNKIELVHLNVPFDPMGIVREYIALVISKILAKKVLLHIHGGKLLMIPTKNKFMLYLIRRILNDSDVVIVLSGLEKDALEANYGYRKSIVLLNAVDCSKIVFNEFRRKNIKLNVLYLARINESKGIDDIIDAFEILYQKVPFKFIVCGVGPDKDKFISRCQDIFKTDFVYEGVVAGQKKWEVIGECDIFILPSRHSEGLPMSLLETMAAGLVPVVTDEASMKYVVIPDENGIRVKKYNGQDISDQMFDIMGDDALLNRYSNASRKTVEAKYDTTKYVITLDEIYSKI